MKGKTIALESTIHGKENNIVVFEKAIEIFKRNNKMLQTRLVALREINLATETRMSIFKASPDHVFENIDRQDIERKRLIRKESKKQSFKVTPNDKHTTAERKLTKREKDGVREMLTSSKKLKDKSSNIITLLKQKKKKAEIVEQPREKRKYNKKIKKDAKK